MSYLPENRNTAFAPLPDSADITLSWPTDNQALFTDPTAYFARTRANPDFGRPGFTRDCGKRFHRGCDIAPVNRSPEGADHRVMFSNCKTGEEYPSDEPGWIPHDTVYSVYKGVVVEIDGASSTGYGNFVIVEHHWGDWGAAFYSLYAHLDKIHVETGDVLKAGQAIGTMGMTSNNADMRNWMAIAPHLHIEFWNDAGENFNPEDFLFAFVGR